MPVEADLNGCRKSIPTLNLVHEVPFHCSTGVSLIHSTRNQNLGFIRDQTGKSQQTKMNWTNVTKITNKTKNEFWFIRPKPSLKIGSVNKAGLCILGLNHICLGKILFFKIES